MALQDYEHLMIRCARCSYCKFIPHLKMKGNQYSEVCPSISKYNFHGFSGGGRTIAAFALQRERLEYTDGFLDMVYKCQMDGGCDVSCKNQRDLEPLEVMLELRAKCVEDGQILPEHMLLIDHLKKEDNMMLSKKSDRGNWAETLGAKDLAQGKAEVLFHAGCRYSFDEDLWPIAVAGANLLRKAGVDLGVMGVDETCCGGRAYEMGYQGELTKYAEHNKDNWKAAGIKTVVTPCSDCYQTFKVLYDKINMKPDVEIFHITEYLHRLIKEGALKPAKNVPLKITYHDPCHLGRLAEPWEHWNGIEKKIMGQLIVHEPPKEFRRGANGVYDIPRDIIRSIPGLQFVEMHRIREYAWCCGAGGGVKDTYPDFALWTAQERIKEAMDVGAEAIVTACPHCERTLKDAIKENGSGFKVYDIVEMIGRSI